MIYANVELTVEDRKTVANKNIVLYRGDANVEIRFMIKDNRFVVLESTRAQMIIERPSATSIFSKIVPIENDTVIFKITAEMIDELKEIGEYTFQIRLYDDEMNARATLPPCEGCLIINQPIVTEGEVLVNAARINDSAVMAATYSDVPEEEIFDDDNAYNRTVWVDGDIITDVRMNKIEDALYYINEKAIDVTEQLKDYATKDYVNETIESIDVTEQLEEYATKDYVDEAIEGVDVTEQLQDYAKKSDIPSVPTKVSQLENDKGYLTEHQDLSHLANKSDVPTKVSELENDKGYLTEHQDISGKADKTELHSHSNKSVLDGITSAKVSSWDNKSTFDGNYNNLTNKPTIPTVTNDLTNELKSNYDTAYNHSQSAHAPSNAQKNSDITKTEIETKLTGNITSHTHEQYLTEHQDLSHLANKSDVPTKVSQLINDSGFLTSVPSEYVTDSELNNKGYATKDYVDDAVESVDISSQLSDYAKKSELHSHDNKSILDTITQERINNWDKGGNINLDDLDLSEYAKLSDLEGLFDDVEFNAEETTDTQTVLDFYSNGEVVKTVYFSGGSGTSATSAYISTTLEENVMIGTGEDFDLTLDFVSPNPGRGTLKVFINDIDSMSTSINQGESTIKVVSNLFAKGTNKVVIYVLDRVGVMSNSLTFYIRYGSTEVTSDFDPYTWYDYGAIVRYYFTPIALDTSLGLTFYMSIDGEVKPGVNCISDTRGYYTFPMLSVGNHKCRAWVQDSNGDISNVLTFNLIILDEVSLAVASDTEEVTVEEGDQLSLDYKVYMKNNYSFITKVYIDNNLIVTGNCGLETSYYKNSTLSQGIHTVRVEVWDLTETKSDDVTWSVNVIESTYVMKEPVTSGATFIASAVNKTNADEGREVWVGTNQDKERIEVPLVNFSWNSESGWIDDQLIFSGNSYAEIPIKPLADNAKYGFTLDIEFLTKPIGVENALVLDLWDEENNCGIKITTEELIMQSRAGNRCDLYFEENEIVSAMFIIDRHEKTAKIYLNGVMCEAFHLSDYEVNGVKYLEDFTVDKTIKLGGKGYSAIRNIRVYQVPLTTNEIINNFIANKILKFEQKELVEFQKGNDLPTMTIYCDFSGLGKDDKKPCNIAYLSTDVNKYGESFTLDGKYSQLQYQGTSSMAYPIKNYRINPRDKDGKKKINPFIGGQPESRFTLKADFITSNHAHNTGMAKFISDKLYNYNDEDEKTMNPMRWYLLQNGKDVKSVRETINGFPIRLILVNDGETALNEGQAEPVPGSTKDMGIFNFNNDKDNLNSMGMDTKIFPNCISYEVTANSDTSAGAFVPYTSGSDKTELAYLQDSFELRYPDEDDVGKDYGYLNMNGDTTKGLKRVIDWVGNCTNEEFVADFDKYFNKHYTLRYYLLVVLMAGVDNLGKNMMLDSWDGQIWYPRFYDIDTILSYDNSGEIKFDVDIEMEQGYWNTSSSRLWTKIRDLMHDELIDTYKNMRANGVTYEGIMKYMYDEQIARIPQSYYNQDYDVKYAPYADQYLGKAHGDGLQHMKRWLKKRFIFCDTLFDYAPSYENDILTIRANTLNQMNITIETYTPLYQHVSFYNGNMEKIKVKPGEPITFSGYAQTETDQEVLIYGGSNIKSITGLATTNPNSMLIGSATRLTELDISNCPILSIVNSNKANFSSHVYLNKLNISNCPQLGGNLNISNSPLLQEVNAKGSGITGVLMPTSARNIEILKLPNTLKTLTLNDVPLLHTLEFDEGLAMDSISISNCNALENYINFDLTQIQNVYLDNAYDNEELYMSITNNLTLMNMPTLQRVIYLPNSEYEEFNVDNMINSGIYKITTFNNPNMTDFIITAPQRLSYKEKDVTETKPNSVFVANTLDLSDTQFENVKILATSDLYNLKVPTTMKNFYCDSAFDIDTNVIEDASYEVIHDDLIEPYTTHYGEQVLLNGETPNIIPSSANGSLIFNMYSNNTIQPTSTSPYIWDLNGLKLNDFYTFGMNNWIKTSDNGSIIMPQRMSGYSVRIVNADITPNQYATHLYPLFINTTLPIVGKIDYTKYQGNTLAWAYAYTTGDVTINPLPSKQIATQITNDYNKLYSTDYVDIRDVWIYKDKDTSKLSTNEAITKVYIELTSDNYKTRIDEVIQCYPNFEEIYLFDDGSVTSLYEMLYTTPGTDRATKIKKITFMENYFENLTDLSRAFINCRALTEVNNIPNSVKGMRNTFEWCSGLKNTPILPSNLTDMCYTFCRCSSLTTPPIIPNSVTNMVSTFEYCTSLTQAPTIPQGVTNMQYTFRECSSLTQAPAIPNSVTNMASTFNGCSSLTTTPAIPSSVTNLTSCFNGCTSLTTVDFNGFDPTGTTFTSIFNGCTSLKTVKIEDWTNQELAQAFVNLLPVVTPTSYVYTDFTNVTVPSGWKAISSVIARYTASTSNTLPVFNNGYTGYTTTFTQNSNGNYTITIRTNDMNNLPTQMKFKQNRQLLTVEYLDTSNLTTMKEMFDYCPSLTSINTDGWDTSKVTNMQYAFYDCGALTTLDVSSFDTSQVTTMYGMFGMCELLQSIDISNFDTGKVTDMGYMFYYCENLQTVNLSNLNLNNVTSFNSMFTDSSKLGTVILNNVTNVSKVQSLVNQLPKRTSTGYVYTDFTNVTLPSGWKKRSLLLAKYTATSSGVVPEFNSEYTGYTTSEVNNGNGTYTTTIKTNSVDNLPTKISFKNKSLTSVEYLNTANVTAMNSMFSGCTALTSLDLSSSDTSNVTSMSGMFYDCTALTSLNLSSFNTSNVKIMCDMFSGCSALRSLDLSSFDTSNVVDMSLMFYNCSKLNTLYSMKNIKVNLSLYNTILSTSSMIDVIENLATVTTKQTLTLPKNHDPISNNAYALAIGKGWTVQ